MAATRQHQVAVAAEHTSAGDIDNGGKWLLALTSLGALMVTLDAAGGGICVLDHSPRVARLDEPTASGPQCLQPVSGMMLMSPPSSEKMGSPDAVVPILVFTAHQCVRGLAHDRWPGRCRTVQGAGRGVHMPMAIGSWGRVPSERRGWRPGSSQESSASRARRLRSSIALPAARLRSQGPFPPKPPGWQRDAAIVYRPGGATSYRLERTAPIASAGTPRNDFPRPGPSA